MNDNIRTILQLNTIFAFVILLSAFSFADLFVKKSYQNLDNQTLAALIDNDAVTLIDIRRAEEWQQTGVIKNSKLLTLFDKQGRTKPRFFKKIQLFPKDKPLVFICRSGSRSKIISQYLGKQGFQKVHNLKDGIISWQKNRYPTVPSRYGQYL